jgi:hypothetical protein
VKITGFSNTFASTCTAFDTFGQISRGHQFFSKRLGLHQHHNYDPTGVFGRRGAS